MNSSDPAPETSCCLTPPPYLYSICSQIKSMVLRLQVLPGYPSGCPKNNEFSGGIRLTSPKLSVDEHFLVLALFLRGSAGFLLGVRVVGELRGAGGHGAGHHELLEVVEDHAVLLGQEGDGRALLAGTTRSTNAMRVVCKRKTPNVKK